MSQSKLSLFPIVIPEEHIPITVLRPEQEREEAKLEHEKLINSLNSTYYLKDLKGYSEIDPRPGLPSRDKEITRFEPNNILAIKLNNSGDLPSTNVHVKLLFKMYASKNVYPKDKVNVSTFIDRELFCQKEVNIHIPYIASNEEVPYKIFELKGQFRETELILISIKANGFTYVKENNILKKFFYPNSKITLNHYKHSFVHLMEEDFLSSQNISPETMQKFYGLLNN